MYHLRRKKRLLFAFFVFLLLFAVLAIRLTYIQAFDGDKLSQAQISQLIGEIPLTASRGDIYDRNDNILAKDSSASQIYVRPSLVEEKEKVAELFSQIFEEKSKEEYLEILNEDTDRLVLIQRKVDNQVALEIEEKEYRGVEVSEDKKRYYTNGNFASYILGFTGSDHQGLYGIEGVFERELKGQDGLLVYEKDGRSQRLPSGYQTRIEPLPGNNIVLTIDSMIQHYLESEAQNSLDELNAKRVIAIAMDPNNGEVLGMTAKPDYDLNNPRTVSSEMIERLHLEENTLGEQQLEMWQNPAVALNYEPGSTFKIITAAAALEEGVVTEQTPFYCDGFVEVDGVKMRCHIYPREHGHQSFFEGVRNSCNPVMVETIRRMHPDTFYKYVYNFGFGERTGIELDGEQSGLVPLIKEDANVDYATKSFGQGISTTPIQLITALSAVVNGGSYYEPSVIKEIIDGETGKVKNDGTENEILRQVVTSENAEILKRIMQEVVAGSDFLQEGTQGYSMGGKTGTAQKIENGSYANGKYITSFFGFAPVEDPKVSILLIVDEPEGYGVTGSTTAAPYAIDVLANALNYMGIEPIVEEGELESSGETQEESTGRNVPDVRGYSVEMAQEILGQSDWDVQYRGDTESETAIVTNQEPMPGAVVSEQTKLFIDFSETQPDGQDGQGMITVPNVLDLSLRRAQKELENLGLSIQIEGNGGFSVKQEPQAGQQVERGTAIVVEFEHVKETDDEDEEKE